MVISFIPPGYIDERSPAVQRLNCYPTHERDNKVAEGKQWLCLLFSSLQDAPFSKSESKKALNWDATSTEKKSAVILRKPFKPHQNSCSGFKCEELYLQKLNFT